MAKENKFIIMPKYSSIKAIVWVILSKAEMKSEHPACSTACAEVHQPSGVQSQVSLAVGPAQTPEQSSPSAPWRCPAKSILSTTTSELLSLL